MPAPAGRRSATAAARCSSKSSRSGSTGSEAACPTASPAIAAASTSGSCTSPAGRSSSAPGRSRAPDGSRSRRFPRPRLGCSGPARRPRPTPTSSEAIGRTRHALAVDDDLSDFQAPLPRATRCSGPLIRRMPWLRVRRCPSPWEAFAWAVTEQLIESARGGADPAPDRAALGNGLERSRRRAAARRRARAGGRRRARPGRARRLRTRAEARPGARQGRPRDRLRPLRPRRSRRRRRACSRSARSARGRSSASALKGRGDLDSLPAGDVAYLKLVGHLSGLGRRATVAEVEDFYARYAPYRALAGRLTLAGLSAGDRGDAAAPATTRRTPSTRRRRTVADGAGCAASARAWVRIEPVSAFRSSGIRMPDHSRPVPLPFGSRSSVSSSVASGLESSWPARRGSRRSAASASGPSSRTACRRAGAGAAGSCRPRPWSGPGRGRCLRRRSRR